MKYIVGYYDGYLGVMGRFGDNVHFEYDVSSREKAENYAREESRRDGGVYGAPVSVFEIEDSVATTNEEGRDLSSQLANLIEKKKPISIFVGGQRYLPESEVSG